MHPAVAFGLPRVVPDGGLKIGDKFFPAGVCDNALLKLLLF